MAKRTRYWILSRLEPNGDTVCTCVYDNKGNAEAECTRLPDVSALRDFGEAACVVNVVTVTNPEDLPEPGEVYATWQAPPTWLLFRGHEKLEAAGA